MCSLTVDLVSKRSVFAREWKRAETCATDLLESLKWLRRCAIEGRRDTLEAREKEKGLSIHSDEECICGPRGAVGKRSGVSVAAQTSAPGRREGCVVM